MALDIAKLLSGATPEELVALADTLKAKVAEVAKAKAEAEAKAKAEAVGALRTPVAKSLFGIGSQLDKAVGGSEGLAKMGAIGVSVVVGLDAEGIYGTSLHWIEPEAPKATRKAGTGNGNKALNSASYQVKSSVVLPALKSEGVAVPEGVHNAVQVATGHPLQWHWERLVKAGKVPAEKVARLAELEATKPS